MAKLEIVDTGGGPETRIIYPQMLTDDVGYGGAGHGFLEFGDETRYTPGSFPFQVDQDGNITAATINAAVGLAPSGDTSGAKDVANIAAAYVLGAKTVSLAQGTFYVGSPIAIPPYSALVGQFNSTQVSETDGGTVLKITSGFTGTTISDSGSVTLKSAILLLGQTFGGYSTTSEEQKIRNLMIDGSSAPSGVQGILSYGRVSRVHLTEVLISQVTGDGLQQNVDSSGNQPDAWFAFKVFSRFNGGKGYSLRSADSTWYMCLSSNNGDTGVDWFINTTSNSKYYACRSEHSAGIGFGFVCVNHSNSSGDVLFQGCSTDQSTKHGFQIGGTINSVTSFVVATPVVLNGCVPRRDGANSGSGGGGYAGIYIADYGSVVILDGCQVFPGVNDDGSGTNSPQIGLLADSGSNAVVSGCHFHAATTAISDSAGLNYDNTVTTATGTTASPTVNTSPNIAQYQGAGITLTPANAPSADPLHIVSAGSGQRAMGVVVTGGSNFDSWKLTSDGKQLFGTNAATQDTALFRDAAGRLAVSTDGSAGTFQPLDPYGGGFGFFAPSSTLGHGNSTRSNYTNATDSLGVSGTIYLVAYYYPAGTTITNVNFFTGTGTLKTGGTHGWYIVCDSSRVIRAVSADQTDASTVWGTASTAYPLAVLTSLSAKYVTPYSGLYYHGIMVAETTGSMPNLVTGAHMAAGVAGIAPLLAFPCTGASGTGQTTPPAADGSVTLTAGSADGTKNFLTWAT